uniref:Uncharacterized protein n=1 Tax=Rhizophora mucronata TaxID=61149 RepID=A0A2P2MR21_RHIMU
MDASDIGFVIRGVGDSVSWLLGSRENCSFANQIFLQYRFLGNRR